MKNIIWIIVLELVPITMWIVGASCTKNKTKYPNTSLGYKTEVSVKSKLAWDYANEYAGKLANMFGTVLFILNALVVLFFDITWPMLIVNILAYILLHFAVTKAIDKKFTETGKLRKGI